MIFPGKKRDHIIFFTLMALYVLWLYFFIGIRDDHVSLLVVLTLFFAGHKTGQKIIIGFSFFLFYWIIFDSIRIIPNYLFNPVHIVEPYEIDKALFGVNLNGERLTLNEYFAVYNHKAIDIITSLFYLFWVPAPMIFAFYCFFKHKKILLQFWLAFFTVNLFGFAGYYLYPAAPPWYYDEFGAQFIADTPSNAARLLKFDGYFGVDLFRNMYSKGSSVFAAIPSMHSAFPVLLFYFGNKLGKHWLSFLFLIVILGIWFAAIYLNHHYVIDVILGFLCAIATIILLEKWLFKTVLKDLLETMYNRIK